MTTRSWARVCAQFVFGLAVNFCEQTAASASRILGALLLTLAAGAGLGCDDPDSHAEGPVRVNAAALVVDIDDCAGLQAISQDRAGTYRLVADIDCTGFDAGDNHGFLPIGDGSGGGAFTGSLDGDGHTITGLTIVRPDRDNVGLFGVTEGALIERVGLVGAQIQGGTASGALIGAAVDTTVRESFATGSVSGIYDVGGLVGGQYQGGSVADCYAVASVIGAGDYGLLVGWVESNVQRGYASGACDPAAVGTVCAYCAGAGIQDSFFDCEAAGDCESLGGRSTSEMHTLATYVSAGWDFDATWGSFASPGYPCLRWQDGCGCAASFDSDGDGVPDCSDGCSADPMKTAPGACGCGHADADSDGDGPIDCDDGCPHDPTKVQPGQCGCNEPDVDADGDGLLNCNDPDWTRAIRDCAELQSMQANLAGKYRLVLDIDCAGFDAADGKGFEPIGNEEPGQAFTGTFDGQGYSISNLRIERSDRNSVGLFGVTDGAVIERVGLIDAQIEGGTATGALVGGAVNTTVRQCFATGTVSGAYDVGGLVGGQYSGGLVEDSYAAVSVTGAGDYGLLVGWVEASVERGYAAGVCDAATLSAICGGCPGAGVEASFFDCDLVGDCSAEGATSTAAMSSPSTYTAAGWDFDTTWSTRSSSAYPCLQWENGCDLIGYWSFDEASGSAVLDSSGSGVDGTISNATRDAGGRSGGALYFNGTSSVVTIPDGAWNVGTPVTYSAWYKADGSPKGYVFEHRATGVIPGAFGYLASAFSGASYDSVRFAADDSVPTGVGINARGPASPGVWMMATVTISPTAIRVYKNGVFLKSAPITGGLPKLAGNLFIGSRGEVPDGFFKGWIDEVSVYGHALSDGEVARLYSSYGPPPTVPWAATGLVGRWKLDEGSGSVAQDSSGYGSHGALQGAATWDPNGVSGSCVRFDGSTSLVQIPDGIWDQTGNVTYIAWYKKDPDPAGSVLVEHEAGSNIPGVFLLRSDNPGWGAYDNTNTGRPTAQPIYTPPPPGEWRMLALVFTPTAASLYSNGTLVGTSPLSGGVPYYPGRLFLGGRGSQHDFYFRGWIDEVSIYARSLSADELLEIYNTTLNPYPPAQTCDGDCAAGLICAFGVSARFGLPSGTGVCWDGEECGRFDGTNCGTPTSLCGDSCCVPRCDAEVGVDDGCDGVCEPCVPGADSDGDGLSDCEERNDDDAWTDALAFNGISAERGDSCHVTPTCAAIDTEAEVDACFTPLEDHVLRAGWSFSTSARDICDPEYGFDPAWEGCGTDFAVHYQGLLRLREAGVHCFGLAANPDNQCGALIFNGEEAITPEIGARCYELPAGLYPIEWFYETTSQQSNALHVVYCFGSDFCEPLEPIAAEDLRPSVAETDRACPTGCSELCPCGVGGPTDDPSQCAPGLVVRDDVAELFGLPAGTAVCWDPLCDDRSSGLYECGTPTARCGTVCPSCTANCSGKSCGWDGCFGRCGDGICDAGESGCASDADCAAGLACIVSGDGRGTCRPELCASPMLNPCSDPRNAGAQTECGPCGGCEPDCSDRECGDDGCGGSCGSPDASQYCSPEGHVYALPDTAPPDPPLDGATVAGTLPGKLQATAFGEAAYTIPLQLPPGRNGIEPALTLSYNSAAGDGPLGLGWSLSGLSRIDRCPKTLAQDGELGGVTYTEDDAFCLDGRRLVLQDEGATYGADGTFYRAEIDSFSRVESKGTGPEPESFEVRTRDGRILTYAQRIGGNTPLVDHGVRRPDYVEPDPSQLRTQTWALTRVEDRLGNAMTIDYFIPAQCIGNIGGAACDPTIGGSVREFYPRTMRYTSADSGALHLDSDRFVRFSYRARNDRASGYRYGVRYERTQLLESITAAVRGQPAFFYQLSYEEPQVNAEGQILSTDLNKQTKLTSVQQCARSSLDATVSLSCKPATTLTYEQLERGFTRTEGGAGGGEASQGDLEFVGRALRLDVDGNGQDDVLFPVCTGYAQGACSDTAFELVLNGERVGDVWPRMVVTGRNPPEPAPRLGSGWLPGPGLWGDATVPARVYVADLDLDGRDELLEVDVQFRKGKNGQVARVWRWDDAARTFDIATIALDLGGSTPVTSNLYLLDGNGDGAMDLIDCVSRNGASWRWTFREGDRTGDFEDPGVLTEDGPRCFDGVPIDLNGDGAQELLLNVSSLQSLHFGHSAEASSDVIWPLSGDFMRSVLPVKPEDAERILMDLNADGLQDVVEFTRGEFAKPWINTGSGFMSLAGRGTAGPSLLIALTDPENLRHYASVIDEDGDGRQDLLVPAADLDDTQYTHAILRWRGGAFVASGLPDTNGLGRYAVADLDHDGQPDLLGVGERHLRRGAGAARLESVTNGLGARSSVQYAEVSDDASEPGIEFAPTIYAVEELPIPECAYPCYARHPKGAVVRRISDWDRPFENGLAAARSFRYQYFNGAIDLRGRGNLGFGGRYAIDEARERAARAGGGEGYASAQLYPNTERDPYLEIYPFVGMASLDAEVADFAADRSQNRTVDRTLTADHTTPSGRSVYPYARREEETVEDWSDGTMRVLRNVVTTRGYDSYGNHEFEHTVWEEFDDVAVDELQVGTSFVLDDAHVQDWLINQPRERTTFSQRGGGWDWQSERFSYFEDWNAEALWAMSGLLATREVEPDNPDAALLTTFAYDEVGKLSDTMMSGVVTGGYQVRAEHTTYDDAHMFPISMTDARGHEVQVSYDAVLGMRISSSEAVREGATVTSYSMPDGFGRPRKQVDVTGIATTITYLPQPADVGGYVVESARPGAPFKRVQYDVLGREVSRQTDGMLRPLVVETHYSDLGLVSEVSRPHSDLAPSADFTTFAYDALDRRTSIRFADGATTYFCYDGAARCTLEPSGYPRCEVSDEHGDIVYRVDPPPPPAERESCDEAAAAVAQQFPQNGDPLPSANRPATRYRYGQFDTVTSTTDPAGAVTTFEYDNYARLKLLDDPARGVRRFTYDAYGQLATQVDGEGQLSSFHYDELGRKIRRADHDADGVEYQESLWIWDDGLLPGAYGKLAVSESPQGVLRYYGYDAYGRPSELATYVPDADGEIQSMVRRTDYDAAGRLSTTTYESATDADPSEPEHAVRIRRGYTEGGRLEMLYRPGANAGPDDPYDPANDQAYWLALAEDPYGQLEREQFGNGLVTTRGHVPGTGRLERLTTRQGNAGALRLDDEYRYYDDGRLSRWDDHIDGHYTTYSYDRVDRLGLATTRDAGGTTVFQEGYTYTDGGDIETRSTSDAVTGWTSVQRYYYEDPDRPSRVSIRSEGEARQLWDYDGNGNLRSRVSDTAGVMNPLELEYNRLGKPSRIGSPDDPSQGFELGYDADGNRTRKHLTLGAEPETFYLDEAYQRTRVPGTSGAQDRVLVFAGGRAVSEVLLEPNGTSATYSLHEDRLGSITAVGNPTGQVIDLRRYEAFGKHRPGVTTTAAPARDFTGHDLDAELGLIDMEARIYDPEAGRFLQADGVIDNRAGSRSSNAYAYVSNDPLNRIDPTGNISISVPPFGGGNPFGGLKRLLDARMQIDPVASTYRPPTSQGEIQDRTLGMIDGQGWLGGTVNPTDSFEAADRQELESMLWRAEALGPGAVAAVMQAFSRTGSLARARAALQALQRVALEKSSVSRTIILGDGGNNGSGDLVFYVEGEAAAGVTKGADGLALSFGFVLDIDERTVGLFWSYGEAEGWSVGGALGIAYVSGDIEGRGEEFDINAPLSISFLGDSAGQPHGYSLSLGPGFGATHATTQTSTWLLPEPFQTVGPQFAPIP